MQVGNYGILLARFQVKKKKESLKKAGFTHIKSSDRNFSFKQIMKIKIHILNKIHIHTFCVPNNSCLICPPPNSFFKVAFVDAYNIFCLTYKFGEKKKGVHTYT